MSTNLATVLQELLQNTTNLKALRELMTPDATYVSLNFDNPELKKVMPWAGTHKGPQELLDGPYDSRKIIIRGKIVSIDHGGILKVAARQTNGAPASATNEEIREFVRLASASFGHAVGTCKIGVDELAVVDQDLRVRGILGLRVADASVMPRIITGPGTAASTHMIAGRAAQLILG